MVIANLLRRRAGRQNRAHQQFDGNRAITVFGFGDTRLSASLISIKAASSGVNSKNSATVPTFQPLASKRSRFVLSMISFLTLSSKIFQYNFHDFRPIRCESCGEIGNERRLIERIAKRISELGLSICGQTFDNINEIVLMLQRPPAQSEIDLCSVRLSWAVQKPSFDFARILGFFKSRQNALSVEFGSFDVVGCRVIPGVERANRQRHRAEGKYRQQYP